MQIWHNFRFDEPRSHPTEGAIVEFDLGNGRIKACVWGAQKLSRQSKPMYGSGFLKRFELYEAIRWRNCENFKELGCL